MAEVDPANAGKYFAESNQYRKALQKAVDRAIALSPVIRVRNGTYRSYIPPIFYIRGPSVEQVVQLSMTDEDWSLEAVDSTGIPAVDDVRVDGNLDVYEDVMSRHRENTTHGSDRFQILTQKRREVGLSADEDWFWGGFSSQLGYSYVANVYLRRDEVSSFLRQWVNNYAVFVNPAFDYFFIEWFDWLLRPWFAKSYETGEWMNYSGATRNSHALAYFMEQFRSLLVWEDGNTLWLAKATPRHWLEQGKRIAVSKAPTYFGVVGYEIVSDSDHGKIEATVEMPSRHPPQTVLLRFRHPRALPMKSVTVNRKLWTDFDPEKETVALNGLTGTITVTARY
jgi:hypothetical protein